MIDESFYVLEGELEMSLDGEALKATPGYFINVRRGAVHGYRNAASTPAKYLTWTHPAGIEHFYEEISLNVKRLPDDLGKVLSIAEKHQIQLMPPREG
jgi:mannose-6-phosphate isomerase-like protein (cupin superfamily)